MKDYPETFSNEDVIRRIIVQRKEMTINPYTLATAIAITEEESMLYETGVEDIPASVLLYVSLPLTGNPYELYSLESEIARSKRKA